MTHMSVLLYAAFRKAMCDRAYRQSFFLNHSKYPRRRRRRYTLESGIDTFRKYSANAAQILPPLKKCVDQHIELAVNIFKKIWSDDTLDINIRLFIAYIVEERMRAFGDRWMAEGEIENIRQWESKNTLDSTLSNNYGSCLEFFVQNELVYASSWTRYGNPREYTLFPSLQELLFNCPHKIMEELQKVKDAYHLDFPF